MNIYDSILYESESNIRDRLMFLKNSNQTLILKPRKKQIFVLYINIPSHARDEKKRSSHRTSEKEKTKEHVSWRIKMSITTNNVNSILDSEECFLLWVQLGSVAKVSLHLEALGKVNRATGKRFSNMGIWNAAIRWVSANPDLAWPYYVDAGTELTREEWEEWLVSKAMIARGYSKRNFLAWVRRMGFEKYEYVYAERYGISQ